MGLDQYLYLQKDKTREKELLYWRKVNFLHGFFTAYAENTPEEDNCTEFIISRDTLVELKERCEKIIETKNSGIESWEEVAKELLPVQCGFFFGSYEYDEYYFDDIKDVLKDITDVLLKYPEEDTKFVYYAWY